MNIPGTYRRYKRELKKRRNKMLKTFEKREEELVNLAKKSMLYKSVASVKSKVCNYLMSKKG